MELEEQIYKEFSKPPENPVIKVYHVTQTWVALEWEPLVLNSVELKEIDIFKNGQRIQTRRLSDTKVKISGLGNIDIYHFYYYRKIIIYIIMNLVFRYQKQKLTLIIIIKFIICLLSI